MRRTATTAAAVRFCYRPRLPGMAIYADGVPMTDKVLGLMALCIGGALGWLMFGPIMAAPIMQGATRWPLIFAAAVVFGLLLGSLLWKRR